jgi:hypothetical protein
VSFIRGVAAALTALVLMAAFAMPAGAVVGSRTITTVGALTMTSTLGSGTLSASYSVTVSEVGRTGTNPWSLQASIPAPLADGAGDTIPGAALSVSNRDVHITGSGGTDSAPQGTQDLSAPRTLFTNAGQSTLQIYSGTHAATGTITLTPPNATVAAVYTGTFTVTLIQ